MSPPAPPPAPLLRYLRDCYRADAGGAAVHDLFDRKVEHLRFFDREVLLTAELPRRPLHAADIAPAAKAAALYRRERSLVYCAWPLVGEGTAPGGRPVRLCAPLLLYPATLHPGTPPDDDLFWLEVDLAEQRVNAAALEALLGPTTEAGELPARLPLPPLDLLAAADLTAVLGACIPGLALPDLAAWPRLQTGEEVQAARAERDGAPRLLRAAGLALIPNPPDSGGILHELDALAGAGPPYSPPLSLLLGPPPSITPAGPPIDPPAGPPAAGDPRAGVRTTAVPVVLSTSQNRALAAAARFPLSVIVGPPGTGKSTTLAALVLEHLGRGASILVAARTPQALDVLEEKIGSLLGAPAPGLRADRGPALAALKDRLEELLSGRLPVPEQPAAELDRDLRRQSQLLEREERRLERLAGLERRWGELAEEPGALAGLSRAWTGWRLRGEPPLWELLEAYQDRLAGRGRLAAAALRAGLAERASLGTIRASGANGASGPERSREEAGDRAARAALRTLLGALRARQSARQLDLLGTLDPRRLLAALPLWLVPFADLHRALPLAPGLFDLVVIDEATQCDLATALPALARARRAVVTGDPRQLRHLSFLSRARQGALGERHGLAAEDVETFDYRGRSLLDRALEALDSPAQAVFLDEHFRSAPGLVAFSNREFYGGALRVMTRRPATLARRCLELRPGPGRREADGANPEEAERLVAELAARLAAEASPTTVPARTFGVLSPFRSQVELLERRIAELLPLAAIERHRLRVGTPYAFQGDERDEMLLSLVLDDAAPAGAFRYLERPDVWNVAVTRARHRQVVFTSLSPGRPPAGTLLRRYLEAAAEVPAPSTALAPAGPPGGRTAARLAEELRQAGIAVWPAFEVAGTAVDLLVEDQSMTGAVETIGAVEAAREIERSLAVDLIGFPGEGTAPFGLDRCRMLRRAGLPVFPLPARLWTRDPAACLAALRQRLAAAPGD